MSIITLLSGFLPTRAPWASSCPTHGTVQGFRQLPERWVASLPVSDRSKRHWAAFSGETIRG